MKLPLTLVVALGLAPLAGLPADDTTSVANWTFDEPRETGAVEQVSGRLTARFGAFEFVPGVRGEALKFDGFTVNRPMRQPLSPSRSRVARSHPCLIPRSSQKNWGNTNAKLALDGTQNPQGKDFRFGHRQTLEGTDLIVWVKTESRAALTFRLEPQPQP